MRRLNRTAPIPHQLKSMDKKVGSVGEAIEVSSSVVKSSLWVEIGTSVVGSSREVTPTSSDASIATTPRMSFSGSVTPGAPSPVRIGQDDILGQGASAAIPEGVNEAAGSSESAHPNQALDDFLLEVFARGGGDCDDHAEDLKSPEPEPYTDEELVAMLAGCAGGTPVVRSPSPIQHHDPQDVQSDLQIMSRLAECAGEIDGFGDDVGEVNPFGMLEDL